MVVIIIPIVSHAQKTLVIQEVITILPKAVVAWLVTLDKMEAHALVRAMLKYFL